MTRNLSALWLVSFLVSAALPLSAGAELLYDCPSGAVGDQIYRGFYIEDFGGSTITTVMLQYSTSGQVGQYSVRLIAHQGTYDGPVIGYAETGFSEAGTMAYYDFHDVAIEPSTTIAFVQEFVSAPTGGNVYYDVGTCGLGDPDCTGCPGVIQTDDTTPPLSTFRRAGVRVALWGRADTPVDQSTWSSVKSLFR